MSVTQSDKAVCFRKLHDGPGAFVIPNPWDIGSARILAGLGFQALATTSAASAAALGRRDGELTRDEALTKRPRKTGSFWGHCTVSACFTIRGHNE
jgi:2-methylisocitrate lyase-like PEP mutase family enzyme